MRELVDNEIFNKIVLVSGDGDFVKMVEYFRNKDKLEKVIFPSEKRSSLYKGIEEKYGHYLEEYKKNLI